MKTFRPISVRLDPRTLARLRRLSRRSGWTQSQVVREAVVRFSEPEADAPDRRTAADRLQAYIGAFSTGGADLSVDTHEKYRTLLHGKRRARRSR